MNPPAGTIVYIPYSPPEPLLIAAGVVLLCAAALFGLRWGLRQGAEPPTLRRWVARIVGWASWWALALAVGCVLVYLRFRLDPFYQPSDTEGTRITQFYYATQIVEWLALATLALTGLLLIVGLLTALLTRRVRTTATIPPR